MHGYGVGFAGERLVARASGALWWPARRWLIVADLHLGKAERMARRGGPLLPPYEVAATLERLAGEIALT
ncbi:MAG: metallophosphoesterase, partial [Paracoccus sp. (in: a-proteobacteria)]